MKVNKYLLIIATVIISMSLLGGVYVYFGNGREAQAQSIVSYQTTTLEDGTTGYTETTYTSGSLVGYYGLVQIHAVATLTDTNTITMTPQFSNEPVSCASINATTGWFDAIEHTPYVATSSVVVASGAETETVTTTVTSGSLTEGDVTVQLIMASGTVEGREALALGRCFRVKMEAAPGYTFTPTVYARMVNRQ